MKNTNHNKLPVYRLLEAIKIVYTNISEKLKKKYSLQDIRLLLQLEDDFYDTVNLNIYNGEQSISESSMVVENNQLQAYILKYAAESNVLIDTSELEEILDAELIYYKMIGAVEKVDGGMIKLASIYFTN